jgi:ABC-2 type transport system ATP-binding protein
MDSISDRRGVDQDERGADQAVPVSAGGAGNAGTTGVVGTEPVVSVSGLVKRYGGRQAVAGIDFEVRRGEIFAFLGPNGAGKTTTVEILEGFRQRTDGEINVLGAGPGHGGRRLA